LDFTSECAAALLEIQLQAIPPNSVSEVGSSTDIAD